MSVSTTRLITYEDSLRMPENRFEEVVDGELITMPPASLGHASLIEKIEEALANSLPISLRPYQNVGFLMRRKPFRYRVPDIAVMDRELVRREASEARDPYCRIVPALVIEVWSPSNRKGSLNDLLANYAEFGVPETIVFYPEQRLCQSYSGIECTQSVAGGAFHPLSMPEVKIDLDEIWK